MQDITDNLFWDQLLQLIEDGYVIPIVGRDLLKTNYRGQDTLLYPLIAQKLAEYLNVAIDNLQEGDEINSIVYRYVEKGKRIEDIYSALKIVMPRENEISVPDCLVKLAAIRSFNLFVTTTFDSLLQRAINENRFDGQSRTEVYSYSPNEIQDLPVLRQAGPDATAVFHLFGKLSAIPSYAVTQEDTLEFIHSLQSETRQPRILFDELNQKNLLLLGCSFTEWLARFFIRTAKHQRLLEARGSINFVADSRLSGDRNLVLFLRHYSSRTRILDGVGATEFIDELHQRWTKRHPHETKVNTGLEDHLFKKEYSQVFLSYANEDLDAAVRIRDSLENEGISVFFDKTGLEAGEDFEMELKRRISECVLFIPVISKSTLTKQRRFFRIEWNQASDESKKAVSTESFIIPVVIDNTEYTEPAVPENFRKLHWAQLPDGETNSDFVSRIKNLYRNYQKMEAASL